METINTEALHEFNNQHTDTQHNLVSTCEEKQETRREEEEVNEEDVKEERRR